MGKKKKDESLEVAATEAILTSHQEEPDDMPCINTECFHFSEHELNGCAQYDVDFIRCEDYKHDPANDTPDGFEDASNSIPENSETVSAGGEEITSSGVFMRNLPVDLTEKELGEFSEEQARLFQLLLSTRELKKASNKTYGDQIKDIEKKLDDISQVVEEGTEERPVECRWEYDYDHNKKKLIRVDTGTEVEEKTLTAEELQMNLELSGQASIENVKKAFGNGEEERFCCMIPPEDESLKCVDCGKCDVSEVSHAETV